MFERRRSPRKPVDVFFNRFLAGHPYLCRAIDLSPSALFMETFAEPATSTDRFPLELRLPGDRDSMWLWARRARRDGQREALEFVSMSAPARNRIQRYLDEAQTEVSRLH